MVRVFGDDVSVKDMAMEIRMNVSNKWRKRDCDDGVGCWC